MAATTFQQRIQTNIGYKVYTAIIEQNGTNAPTVVTLLQNTLSGTPAYSYGGPGGYAITLSGEFTIGRTAVFMESLVTDDSNTVFGFVDASPSSMSANAIALNSYDTTFTLSDDIISASAFVAIEIRVYL